MKFCFIFSLISCNAAKVGCNIYQNFAEISQNHIKISRNTNVICLAKFFTNKINASSLDFQIKIFREKNVFRAKKFRLTTSAVVFPGATSHLPSVGKFGNNTRS
jgi:hypothetical protein